MGQVIFLTGLIVIVIAAWFLPGLIVIAAAVVLAIAGNLLNDLHFSVNIVLLILASASYIFTYKQHQNNTLLRLTMLMLIIWALACQIYHSQAMPWYVYLGINPTPQLITVNYNLEKILAASIIAGFLWRINKQKYLTMVACELNWIRRACYLFILASLGALLFFHFEWSFSLRSLYDYGLSVILLSFSDEIIYHFILQTWLAEIALFQQDTILRWLPLGLVSLIYAILNYKYGSLVILLTAAVGSATGYLYQKSGKIELAILLHLSLRLGMGIAVTLIQPWQLI